MYIEEEEVQVIYLSEISTYRLAIENCDKLLLDYRVLCPTPLNSVECTLQQFYHFTICSNLGAMMMIILIK